MFRAFVVSWRAKVAASREACRLGLPESTIVPGLQQLSLPTPVHKALDSGLLA